MTSWYAFQYGFFTVALLSIMVKFLLHFSFLLMIFSLFEQTSLKIKYSITKITSGMIVQKIWMTSTPTVRWFSHISIGSNSYTKQSFICAKLSCNYCLLLFKVCFIRIKSSVFLGWSHNHCRNNLSMLRSSFLSVFIFCSVVKISGASIKF